VEIPLTKGQVAYVDDVDADLAAFNWYAVKSGKTFYARRKLPRFDGKQKTVGLHQEIARRMGIVGPPDHIDRDGRNNRRDNLRPDPNGRNNANKVRFANNTSGYKGVGWCERLGKWPARIRVNNKLRHLGYYADKIEAAKAYDKAALEAWGEFAVVNFPELQAPADLIEVELGCSTAIRPL